MQPLALLNGRLQKPTYFCLIVILILSVGCIQRSDSEVPLAEQAAPSEPSKSLQHQFSPVNEILHGKVIAVLDGDTLDILDKNKKTMRIRLHGIDAPEKGQPFGRTAKEFLALQLAGKHVQVQQVEKDRYGRTIGDISVGGKRISVEMIKAGLAWHYVQFASDDQDLASAELEARSANRGLWADKRYVEPWQWRKLSKEDRDKLR
jgi:endonuclease YncB( thermonuclease family)